MKLPYVQKKTEYIPFKGGLDLETPRMAKYPGGLDLVRNYVPSTEGGYSLIDGYERYSGLPSPSDASYSYAPFSFTDTVSVGDAVTGVDSSATGVVVIVGDDYIDITKVVGIFQEEVLNVSGSPVGSITGDVLVEGEPFIKEDAIAMGAAADEYRGDISAPVGFGAVRGLEMLKGILYCFIDNPGGTAGLIFKESAAGWVVVPFYFELSFDTGIAEIFDGDSITQLVSAATADVKRVVLESGTWAGGDAAGRLILDNIAGVFDATNDIQVSAATKVTSTSLAVQITLSPGGRYETIVHNFFGSLDRKRIYGCDGVNRGFEFDGDAYVPIETGMVTDTPEYVGAYKKQLFFSFKASSQNSGIGEPYKWTAITGATEIALGDDITGYVNLPKAFGIISRNETNQLLGSSVSDFVLDEVSEEEGGLPRTVQKIGYAYCLDDRGIIKIRAVQDYGNFSINTVSRKIQQAIDAMQGVVIASTVYRRKNQYRLYGSDGSGICMTMLKKGVAFSQFNYVDNVACTLSREDSGGKEVIFFGSDEGMVYQTEKGTSFDGEEIEFYFGTSFNHSKTPTIIKTYRTVSLELNASGYTVFNYLPIFDYGNPGLQESIAYDVETEGQGGLWDISSWDTFFYDAAFAYDQSIPIVGEGVNMSLTVYGSSAIDAGHKIDGMTLQYVLRRSLR